MLKRSPRPAGEGAKGAVVDLRPRWAKVTSHPSRRRRGWNGPELWAFLAESIFYIAPFEQPHFPAAICPDMAFTVPYSDGTEVASCRPGGMKWQR